MANMGLNMGRDLRSFYEGKKVLITGHTGFKGSWLSIWLKELDAEIVGYGLDPYTEEDNFIVCNLQDKIIDIRGDIRDKEKLHSIFDKYQPEIVFHLGAQSLVKKSYENPQETYEVNVMGTLNILENIKNCNYVKVGILVTTDKCYENKEQIWSYRENDSLGGYDPYSSSKACAEILISSYRNSFLNSKEYEKHGKAISSVRAGNVIGGGDWAENRLFPDCIRGFKNSNIVDIRNPQAIRPWQYVLEPLYGYLILASKMYEDGINYSSAWNFGPDYQSIMSVKEVVKLLIKKWGSGSWAESSFNKVHEAQLLSLDSTKARKYLNWCPKLNIEKAIEFTVDWYKNYFIEDPYKICLKQIKDYLRM